MIKWVIKTNNMYVISSKKDTDDINEARQFDTEAQAKKYAYVNIGVSQSEIIGLLIHDVTHIIIGEMQ